MLEFIKGAFHSLWGRNCIFTYNIHIERFYTKFWRRQA